MSGRMIGRVQRRGQVTVPVGLRAKLGLSPGDVVIIEETSRGVLIVPAELCDCQGRNRRSSLPGGDRPSARPEHLLDPSPWESPATTVMRQIGEVLRSRLRDTDPIPVH